MKKNSASFRLRKYPSEIIMGYHFPLITLANILKNDNTLCDNTFCGPGVENRHYPILFMSLQLYGKQFAVFIKIQNQAHSLAQ